MQVLVARIGKPHGIRGEVTLQVFTDAPDIRFAQGEKLSIEEFSPSAPIARLAPAGELTVAHSRWNKKILVVKFEEITTRNDAELFRDWRLTFNSEEAAEDEGIYEHDVLDLPVYLLSDVPEGELPSADPVATVIGLQTLPTQDLLIVKLANGSEAMIPFVEEIVPEIDLDEGFILIDPPAGLLELGQDDSAAEGGA